MRPVMNFTTSRCSGSGASRRANVPLRVRGRADDTEQGHSHMSAKGRFDQFAKPSANGRYLRIPSFSGVVAPCPRMRPRVSVPRKSVSQMTVELAKSRRWTVSLALDVGLGRLTLSVEGIEVLLEPLVVKFFIGAGFLATRPALSSRRRSPRLFGGPFRDPQRRLFPAEARRSDGRSSWSPSSPWRSGTGCRKSGHSRRSPPPGS